MAQRMESVAPPGGVMLSASTARLVGDTAALGEPEMVRIKGAEEPVCARRLVAMSARRERMGGRVSTLVGRERELAGLDRHARSLDRGSRLCSRCCGAARYRQEPHRGGDGLRRGKPRRAGVLN